MNETRWLIFIHAIPPEPAYFRVRVRRRLRALGAIALKNSVYLLPDSDEAREDFRWLAEEIRAGGGEAIITRSEMIDGPTEAELRTRLAGDDWEPDAVQPVPKVTAANTADYRGRTWATRAGIKVDRMSSAWLIRTRIDPAAAFRFVAEGEKASKGDVRFDMFEGEFTHVGDRCTFEVLLEAFGLRDDAGLVALGEIIHDLDIKDAKYGRPETTGVGRLVEGIMARFTSDEERLRAAGEAFGAVAAGLRR